MLERFLTMLPVQIITELFRNKANLSTILRSLGSIYTVFRNSEFDLPINKIQAEETEECIVMGNAPSLNEVLINYPNFFVGKKKICVNQFARSEHFEKIKPEYYLFMDPAFWEKTASQNVKKMVDTLCGILNEKVKWRMKILMPTQAKAWNMFTPLVQINSNIEICYFNITRVSSLEPLKYIFYKNNLAMPHSQNVLVAGIFLALNLGYKRNYILGADHSWHENIYVDDDNNLYCKEPHCYENKKSEYVSFYKDSAETDKFKLHELFAALSRKFEGYILLEDYSKQLGSKVYNASNKSYIDAFERYKITPE